MPAGCFGLCDGLRLLRKVCCRAGWARSWRAVEEEKAARDGYQGELGGVIRCGFPWIRQSLTEHAPARVFVEMLTVVSWKATVLGAVVTVTVFGLR